MIHNKFFVSGYRFHVYNKRILLIKGEFRNNIQGDEKLFVALDNKKVQTRIEEHNLPIPVTHDDHLITKQYYLWIKLPEDWKEKKKLHVVQYNSDEKKLIKAFSVRTLCKVYREIPHNIDQIRSIDQGVRIKGWYINTEDTIIKFENHNKPLHTDIQRVRRADVLNAFPECKKEDAVGFEAVLPCNKTDVIKVNLTSADRSDFSKVYMNEKSVFNKISQTGELLKKTNNTLHQYGVVKTLEKIQRKLLKKDNIPYEGWLKLRTPKKRELARQANEKFSYMPKISIVGNTAVISAAGGAAVYYTTDGSVPNSVTGILYTKPFEVDAGMIIRAISAEKGKDEVSDECILRPQSGTTPYILDVIDAEEGANEIKYNLNIIAPDEERVTDGIIIFAEYDGSGRFVKMQSEKVDLTADEQYLTRTITKKYADGNIKIFLWNVFEGMIPLAESK